MITIITGTPGAGKTLYTVEKLLLPLIGTEVNGVPRRIFTNIKGLDAEHELIGSGAKQDQAPQLVWQVGKVDGLWKFDGQAGGLRDWHLWAKPGDVIIYDEVQEVWLPRANGSPVPPDIGKLETHRHMGVDFVLITQGINLTERNLSMLCGRHLHVRRVANLPFAIVYEWDGASRSLLYSKAMAKEKWRYNRATYKRYKSAELHTKAPKRLPTVLWVLLAGVVATAFGGPQVYDRMATRFGWKKPEVVVAGVSDAPKPSAGPQVPQTPVGGAPLPASPASAPAPVPAFAGCARSKAQCTCFDSTMAQVEKPAEWCEHQTFAHRPKQTALDGLVVPDQERHQRALSSSDGYDVLAYMGRRAEHQAREAATSSPRALTAKQ